MAKKTQRDSFFYKAKNLICERESLIIISLLFLFVAGSLHIIGLTPRDASASELESGDASVSAQSGDASNSATSTLRDPMTAEEQSNMVSRLKSRIAVQSGLTIDTASVIDSKIGNRNIHVLFITKENLGNLSAEDLATLIGDRSGATVVVASLGDDGYYTFSQWTPIKNAPTVPTRTQNASFTMNTYMDKLVSAYDAEETENINAFTKMLLLLLAPVVVVAIFVFYWVAFMSSKSNSSSTKKKLKKSKAFNNDMKSALKSFDSGRARLSSLASDTGRKYSDRIEVERVLEGANDIYDKLGELFQRASEKNVDQTVIDSMRVSYADKLQKLSQVIGEKYYSDIVENPSGWENPSEQRRKVVDMVNAIDHDVDRSLKRVNDLSGFDAKVALKALMEDAALQIPNVNVPESGTENHVAGIPKPKKVESKDFQRDPKRPSVFRYETSASSTPSITIKISKRKGKK